MLFLFSCANRPSEKENKLVIFHAGSFSVPFKKIIEGFKKENPGVDVFAESSGSLDAARKVTDLKKNCESLVSGFNERALAGVREAKIRAAARRAAEEKKRREEYELALKKQNELKKIEDIREWKLKKYSEWKSNRSMSILDEELEAAGMSFDELIKEFRDMSSSGK